MFAFQVRLVGCKKATGSDFSLVNGDYTRTDLEANGLPVYIKDQNKSPALWYDSVHRARNVSQYFATPRLWTAPLQLSFMYDSIYGPKY